MSNKNTPLAQPIKIGKKTAMNRFAIQPMECADSLPGGGFSDETIERYSNLFAGHAGLVVFESITLQYDSIARTNQIALNINDKESIKAWADFIRKMKEINPEAIFVVQLNHSGEISGGGDAHRVTVKNLYRFEGDLITDEYADDVIKSFIDASKILYDCGADGVDLKFCHGYLGSQILRPYNDRQWKYGGAWENRRAFAFNMMEGVRKVVPDPNFLVGSKISMWEGFPGGQGSAGPDTAIIDLTESIDLIKGLADRGADFFIQSTGTPVHTCELHMPNKNKADDVYIHMTMAKIMKDNLPKDVVVVGGAYSVLNNGKNTLNAVCPEWNSLIHWGNYNIEHNYCDMIALGRQSLADPKLPLKYMEDRVDEINWCKVCDNCGELLGSQQKTGCVQYNKPYQAVWKHHIETQGKMKKVHIG